MPRGGGPGYDPTLIRIVGPGDGGLITDARAPLSVRSRGPAGSLRVLLNGRNVRRQLSATGGGGYSASLALGGALHYGSNLLVVAIRSGGRFGFSASNFAVARRAPGLGAQQLQIGAPALLPRPPTPRALREVRPAALT